MDLVINNPPPIVLSRQMRLREAVILVFCDPQPPEHKRLLHVRHGAWKGLLHWLDTSGLALYFLDRLIELDMLYILPPPVLARLEQNCKDNAARIRAMIEESVAIQREFQTAGIVYAVVKGFSLFPVSVPRLESRSQLDLDFLVKEDGLAPARQILEAFGYQLHARSGTSLDFKAPGRQQSSVKDLYKAGMSRSAELHVARVDVTGRCVLAHVEPIAFHGIRMPVLLPADLMLGQGLHLYKHVCSQFARAAHLIEFRLHVIARYDDQRFWEQLRNLAAGNPSACLRLGVVVLIITQVMGKFAPRALTEWTVDRLPETVKLWVYLYAHRSVLAKFPGNKLYLLLERELETQGVPLRWTLRHALIPRRLPPPIARPSVDESASARIARHRRQLLYSLFRLHFSAVEGVRYLRESSRWQQYKNGLAE